MIYCDHNATTPVLPAAREAIIATLEGSFGNPSSGHALGRQARKLVDDARQSVGKLLGTSPASVTFTSGATEAINHALHTAGPGRFLVSAVEHPAVFAALQMRLNRDTEVLPVGPQGRIDVDAVLEQVDRGAHPALVSVMAANNETGIIQPFEELALRLRERMVPFLVDAVQYVGRLPVDLCADFLVLTGHKIGGIKGAGALVARDVAGVMPLISGGGQEQGRRGGTEAVPAIVGLGAAVKHLLAHRDSDSRKVQGLRDRFETEIFQRIPGVKIVGAEVDRIPNTSLILLPRADAEPVVRRLGAAGFAASTGSACNAGTIKPSRVLVAMGYAPEASFRALRFSFGPSNTDDDISQLLDALPKCGASGG